MLLQRELIAYNISKADTTLSPEKASLLINSTLKNCVQNNIDFLLLQKIIHFFHALLPHSSFFQNSETQKMINQYVLYNESVAK
jgi:hypothetical protein